MRKNGPEAFVKKTIAKRLIDHEYELGVLAEMASKFTGSLTRLDVADPSFDTPLRIKMALVNALERNDAAHYASIRGLPAFAEAVSEFYAREFGVKADPKDEVLATAGSGEALYIVLAALAEKGGEFIVPDPTYSNYASILDLVGGVVKFVPCKEDYHLDTKRIARTVTKRTKAIVLCTPNNPTGVVYSKEELSEVIGIARKNNLAIVSDECYNQLTYDGPNISPASLVGGQERTIVVSSLSKTFSMTGWRLGYLIAPKSFIDQFEKLAFEMRGSVNTAVQYAGAEALRAPRSEIEKLVREHGAKRKFVVNSLRDMRIECSLPHGGYETFPQIPSRFRNSMQFTKFLVKSGVMVKPGIYFGPHGDKNFRIVYCREDSVLKEGMERIAGALKSD
jgi:aspartate/methionine/tyrosine aminotransferase